LMPETVVIGVDPTFFVTEAEVVTLSGRLWGRTLYCSMPLARILTVDELTAIIGHELGHFRGPIRSSVKLLSDLSWRERFACRSSRGGRRGMGCRCVVTRHGRSRLLS
jgi:hypothetical protein